MNSTIIATALFAVLLLTSARGQSDIARELKQLQDERNKAISAATDPINRRYSAPLEQLLRRAIQTNDLDTAVKIRQELQTLGVTSSVNPIVSRSSLVGTWTLSGPQAKMGSRTLKTDGSVSDDSGYYGKWSIEGDKLKLEKKDGIVNLFDMPPREGKLTGKNPKGDTLFLTRSK